MKKVILILGIIFFILVLGIVFLLGFLGYIPFLSKLLGANNPRDLGITYTQVDYTKARAKSQLEYVELPSNTPMEMSIQRSGIREVKTTLNSAEVTALMNDRPYRYWPIKNVQLRINDDGTAELSGIVIKDKLTGYATGIGVPSQVIETVVKLLPPDPTFYLKAKTSLENNRVKDFDIDSVYLGKFPLPVDTLLAIGKINLVKPAFAQNPIEELSKYSGKREAIINFINERLGKIPGFYAKEAYFSEGELHYDGTLSEVEKTVR